MATVTSTSPTTHNSLLRSSVITGLIIGFVDAIVYHWFVQHVLAGVPLISLYQYIASGALGESAFAGSIATAVLGALFHFIFSILIAGIFILCVDRIPLLRRYLIPGALLYGFGVFIVMNMIVTPLSATPPLPTPTMTELIVVVTDHILIFGLLLGILVRRNFNTGS